MKKTGYLTAMLFALGLVFAAGNLFSEEEYEFEAQPASSDVWYEAQPTGYSFSPMAWDTFNASGVLGTDFRASDGTVLGHVHDFAIDPATGRVSSLIVSDIEGLGGQHVAVPFSFISKSGSSILVYNPPEDYQLQFGLAPYRSYGLDRFLSEPAPEGVYEADRMFGATVRTSDGQEAGRIDDFVVDASDGHVVFFVLADVGGTDNRMVAVPCCSVLSRSGDMYVVTITQDRLMTAPVFVWTDTGNRRYAEDLHRYYGLQPYWEIREEFRPSVGTEPSEEMYEGTYEMYEGTYDE